MTKQIMYLYLGTNGTILSPVHLEDTYYVRQVQLTADKGKVLTKDGIHKKVTVLVPEEEVSEWSEVLAGNE